MSDDITIVGSVEKSPIGSPPLKKLKQSRLPFAPVNNKSPRQSESTNEKKRKHSGSDSPTTTPKTPRNESKDPVVITKDENCSIEEKSSPSTEKLPEEKKDKEIVGKKRGRPSLKNKKDKSFSSPKSDTSPVVKRGKQSVSDDASLDVVKSPQSGKNKPEVVDEGCIVVLSDEEDSQSSKEGDAKRKVGRSPSKRNAEEVGTKTPKDGTSDDKEKKGVSGKKRGRPSSSKNKPKDGDSTSVQGDSSPVGKKGRKSVSDLEDSRNVDKGSGGDALNDDKSDEKEDDSGVKKEKCLENNDESENTKDSVDNDEQESELEIVDELEKSCTSKNASKMDKDTSTPNKTEEKSGAKRGRPPGSKNKAKNDSFTSPKSDIKKGRKSVTDLDSSRNDDKADEDEEKEALKDYENSKSTKESRKSVTPQGKDTQKRSAGRPLGSRNKTKSQSSLGSSECSSPGDGSSSTLSNTPVGSDQKSNSLEKTRNILALFANATLKKNQSPQEKETKTKNITKSEETTKNKKNENSKTKKGGSEVQAEEEDQTNNDNTENSEEGTKEDEEEKESDATDEDCNENAEGEIEESNEDVDSKDDDKQDSVKAEKSGDPNESLEAPEAGVPEAEKNLDAASSPGNSSDVGKSPSAMTVSTPTSGSKLSLFSKPKKLTPKQKEREAAKMLKLEEKAKQKEEREKQLQEKIAEKERQKKQKEEEKQKQKEEKEKVKEEIRKKRQEEIDAKKQKKEEEMKKKEEEKMKKEEEKQKKLEEQQRIEDEKQRQRDMLKNKFASFFVSKKREAEYVSSDTEGPFKEFRVKEDMQLAPVVRNRLTEEQVAELDNFLSTSREDLSKTYLSVLKSGSYVKQTSEKTCPEKKETAVDDDDDDDDVMVVDDSDEEIGDCSAMVQDPSASSLQGKKYKAKLLQFCENQRPAYYGTWSKKSSVVSSRRPLAQDKIFDYEYDSDDDWEEEETGESLSDSEGEEKDEKEDGDQYEVDNDFFVPHGYLSDDEGKSDEEEGDADADAEAKGPAKLKETDRTMNTEQLKQKQAEFEEEMKQKTKVLKPRLYGCLWMADENNNAAYDQLMRILGPHKAVTLCSQLPIGSRLGVVAPKEHRDTDGDDESIGEGKPGNFKKYAKTFPEEAVPALIKLLHGNRHGKGKLCREFVDYWRKFTAGELESDMVNHTPGETPVSRTVYISKRKTEVKIQEIGSWKRCLDEAKSRHIMCWYVSQKTREQYGLDDLSISNSWTYINKMLSDKKEEVESEEDTPKLNKIRPITAFAKKIPSTPSSTNTSPSSTPGSTPLHSHLTKSESNLSLNALSGDTPGTAANNSSASFSNTPSSTADNTPSRMQPVSGKKSKKKNLFSTKIQESPTTQKGSIISYFKNNKSSPQTSKGKSKEKDDGGNTSLTEPEIVMLDD